MQTMAEYGKELRSIHLMEAAISTDEIYFEGDGTNIIEAVKYQDSRIYINKTQYFTGLNDSIWNVGIGGYYPLQKWLKDRKGTVMTQKRIDHYRYIIAAQRETCRLMDMIDDYYEVK